MTSAAWRAQQNLRQMRDAAARSRDDVDRAVGEFETELARHLASETRNGVTYQRDPEAEDAQVVYDRLMDELSRAERMPGIIMGPPMTDAQAAEAADRIRDTLARPYTPYVIPKTSVTGRAYDWVQVDSSPPRRVVESRGVFASFADWFRHHLLGKSRKVEPTARDSLAYVDRDRAALSAIVKVHPELQGNLDALDKLAASRER